MTCLENFSAKENALEYISAYGLEGLLQAAEILLNEAMRAERERHINAKPYERTPERTGFANGYKDKTIKTRLGEMELQVPQVREGDFYPSILEKGMRSERSVKNAIAEMYINGVSTRKTKKIMNELCGFEVTSMEVSRAAKRLDEELEKWRNRPLGEYQYLYLDARYEKIREGGTVVDVAVLIGIGINADGKRELVGISVKLSEQEIHWRGFLEELQKRGLHGLKLIISDSHAGLKAARKAVFPTVPWQRCQFHLQQNAQSYVPKKEMKADVASDVRAILNATDREDAERILKKKIEKYEKTVPRFSKWLEESVPESLTVFSFPEAHRKYIRTSNMLERLNKEIKRRTRVVGIFPNEASCLRLTSAVALEVSEEWEMGKRYLPMSESKDKGGSGMSNSS